MEYDKEIHWKINVCDVSPCYSEGGESVIPFLSSVELTDHCMLSDFQRCPHMDNDKSWQIFWWRPKHVT